MRDYSAAEASGLRQISRGTGLAMINNPVAGRAGLQRRIHAAFFKCDSGIHKARKVLKEREPIDYLPGSVWGDNGKYHVYPVSLKRSRCGSGRRGKDSSTGAQYRQQYKQEYKAVRAGQAAVPHSYINKQTRQSKRQKKPPTF